MANAQNKKKKNNKTALHAAVIAAFVIAALLIAVVVITFVKSGSDTILKGVSVGGIDLSGKTVEKAEEDLSDHISQLKEEEIEIVAGSDSFHATYADFGGSYDCRLSAENAYSYGHESFFSSIIPALKSALGIKTELPLSVHINNRIFDETMSSFTDYDKSVQASYEFVEGAIRVTNGVSAYTINPVTAKETLSDSMKNLDFSTVTFTKETIAPIPLDIDYIAENYSKEATSASYYRDADGSIKITEGNDKVTLDTKNAKKIIEANTTPGATFEIPAEIDFAEHTYEELEEALFRDVLGSYTTSFSSSGANRSHNVSLAASSINDRILLPGESLSYNDALGRRTPEAGYKMAGAYLNGETVQEYGGGICQISSTLYVAVLKANLKIDERLCHMFRVAYVPMGLDATVDYGTVDFVFSNDTDYPIKVVSYTTENKQAVCEIIGTKTENFEVTFETTGVSSVPFTTEIIEDPTLPIGEEKIEEEGSNGSKCTVYRIVSVDGVVKSRTKESQSYYMPHKEVKRVGTMPVESTETINPDGTAVVPPVDTEVTTPSVPTEPVAPETPSEPTAPVVPSEPVVTAPETTPVTGETVPENSAAAPVSEL